MHDSNTYDYDLNSMYTYSNIDLEKHKLKKDNNVLIEQNDHLRKQCSKLLDVLETIKDEYPHVYADMILKNII